MLFCTDFALTSLSTPYEINTDVNKKRPRVTYK